MPLIALDTAEATPGAIFAIADTIEAIPDNTDRTGDNTAVIPAIAATIFIV